MFRLFVARISQDFFLMKGPTGGKSILQTHPHMHGRRAAADSRSSFGKSRATLVPGLIGLASSSSIEPVDVQGVRKSVTPSFRRLRWSRPNDRDRQQNDRYLDRILLTVNTASSRGFHACWSESLHPH